MSHLFQHVCLSLRLLSVSIFFAFFCIFPVAHVKQWAALNKGPEWTWLVWGVELQPVTSVPPLPQANISVVGGVQAALITAGPQLHPNCFQLTHFELKF